MGQVTNVGTVLVLVLAPVVALVVAVRRVGRTYGRAVISPDWIVFEPALLPGWLGRTILLRHEVLDRVPTPHGVIVRTRAIDLVLFPLLVPTHDAAELDRALAELDRRDGPAPISTGRRLDSRRAQRLGAVFVLWFVLTTVATCAVLGARFGGDADVDAIPGLTALAIPVLLCAVVPLLSLVRPVHVGRDALAVGEECFGLDAVAEVGLGDGHLVATEGPRSCVARVGPDEARLREALHARLAARGRAEVLGPLPPALGRARRRARAALFLSPLVALPAVSIGAALLAPNFALVQLRDAEGRQVLAAFAHGAPAPAAVVLVDADVVAPVAVRVGRPWPARLGPGAAPVEVDLTRDTFAHVTRDGVRTSRVAWPRSSMADTLRFRGAALVPGAPLVVRQLAPWPADEDPLLRAALRAD